MGICLYMILGVEKTNGDIDEECLSLLEAENSKSFCVTRLILFSATLRRVSLYPLFLSLVLMVPFTTLNVSSLLQALLALTYSPYGTASTVCFMWQLSARRRVLPEDGFL